MCTLSIRRLLAGVVFLSSAMAAIPMAPPSYSSLDPSPGSSSSIAAAVTTAPCVTMQQLLARDPRLVYDQSMATSYLIDRSGSSHSTFALDKHSAQAKPTVTPTRKLCWYCLPSDTFCHLACERTQQYRSRKNIEARFHHMTMAPRKEVAESKPTPDPCAHCHRGQGGWLSSLCQQSCQANLKNKEETSLISSRSQSRKTAYSTRSWRPSPTHWQDDEKLGLVAHYCFKYRWAVDEHLHHCKKFMEPIKGCSKQEGFYPPECHTIVKSEVLKWDIDDIQELFRYYWQVKSSKTISKRQAPTPWDDYADLLDEFQWNTTTATTTRPTGAWLTWRPPSSTLGPRTAKTLEARTASARNFFFDRVFPHAASTVPTPPPTLLRYKHHHDEALHTYPSATPVLNELPPILKQTPPVLEKVLRDSKDEEESETATKVSKGLVWFSVGIIGVLVFSILLFILACIVQCSLYGCCTQLSCLCKENGNGGDKDDDDYPDHRMHRLAPLRNVATPSTPGSTTPPPPYPPRQQSQPGMQRPNSTHEQDNLGTPPPVDPWSPLSTVSPSPYAYNPYTYPTAIAPLSASSLERANLLRGSDNGGGSDGRGGNPVKVRKTASRLPLRTLAFPTLSSASLRHKRAKSVLFETQHTARKTPDAEAEFVDVDLKGPEQQQHEEEEEEEEEEGKSRMDSLRHKALSSLKMRKMCQKVGF